MDSSNEGTSSTKRPSKNEDIKLQDSACTSDKKIFDGKGPSGGKRLKKDDSGINVLLESDNSDDLSDSGANSNCENKDGESANLSELNSPDSGNLESCASTSIEPKTFRTLEKETSINSDISNDSDDNDVSQVRAMEYSVNPDCDDSSKQKKSKTRRIGSLRGSKSSEDKDDEVQLSKKEEDKKFNPTTLENKISINSDISDDSDDDVSQVRAMDCDDSTKKKKSKPRRINSDRESDSSESSEDDEEVKKRKKEEEDKKFDPTPSTPRPVHHWSAPLSAISRQYGVSNNYSPDLFRYQCYGSLHMVQRLELMYKMKKHDGCVNALNFNMNGTKLVTGSDDLDIIIWDWTTSESILDYNSGHTSNVFQAKFLPNSGDCHVVTCARDGQIRLGELSTSGVCKGTRKLGQHKAAAHKLGLHKDNPHVFMSCAEDGHVFLFDVRIERRKDNPQKLVTSMENNKKVPLYSLACNPQKPYEYVVGGRSPYVKVYDTRYTSEENACVKKFCPEHLVNREVRANVTSAVYNYNGQEILVSYNEDIYLFSSNETESNVYLHRYRGHRNSQTIKSVNFFGSKSEYVVSGSDCGYIFFWDKESEHIVKYMYGDEVGVVNCIEPHPNMPVLATSGLDDDIKIWVPSCENEPDLSGLRRHVISNIREQEEDSLRECSDAFVDQSIMFLMQHLSSARFRQRSALWSEGGNEDTPNSSSSDDDDSDNQPVLQCSQS